MANALCNLNRYEEAASYFEKAIEANPNNAATWYNRARLKVKRGDIENSLLDLKKTIEIDKNFIELAKQEKDFGV
jgi:tetratricopeptide (TPR) repeat protein